MRKNVIVMVSVCYLFCMAGCGNKQEEGDVVVPAKAGESATENTPAVIGNTSEEGMEESEIAETARDYSGISLQDMCYYSDGEIDYSFSGLAECEGQWLYVDDGKVRSDYTGVAYKEDGLWYVSDGVLNNSYSGPVEYNGNSLEVTNGKVDSSISFEESDDVVINVPKSEVKELELDDYSIDVQGQGYNEVVNEREFLTEEKGLYRVLIIHNSDGGESLNEYETSFLDKFRNEIEKRLGKVDGSTIDESQKADVYTFEAKANDKYIWRDISKVSYGHIGNKWIRIHFMKPYIDISGANTINDSYNEDAFVDIGSRGIDDLHHPFSSYEYTAAESGMYTVWFDNIEISKGKELYSENNLFLAEIVTDNGILASKEIYVHGRDAQLQAYLEEGNTYKIRLSAKCSYNSEAYYNGDVTFSMHIGYEKPAVDITGYTSVTDSLDYLGQKNIYTITPCRKQNIKFQLSEVKEGAYVSMQVYDYSGNCIKSNGMMQSGMELEMADAMKEHAYRIIVTSTEPTRYKLSIEYD